MKKMLLAVSMGFAATAVQASPSLVVLDPVNVTIEDPFEVDTGAGWVSLPYQGTTGQTGTLAAGTDKTSVLFTYLGQESGFFNFSIGTDDLGNPIEILESEYGATYTTAPYAAGETIYFAFDTQEPGENGFIANGGPAPDDETSIVFLDAGLWNDAKGTDFDWLVGYNDPASPAFDADDMVFGVKAVPVPAALPLMASALGMFGIARRRKTA